MAPLTPTQSKPSDFFLKTNLDMQTDEFHYFCDLDITSSTDFAKAEARFRVESVTVLKRNVGPRHEFLHVAVRDGEEHKDRNFLLERTVDEEREDRNEGVIEAFFDHEEGMKVFGAVIRALLDIPMSMMAAGAAVVAGPAGLSVSALGSAILPLVVTLVDENSSDSVIDKVSVNAVNVLDFFSQRTVSRRVSKSIQKPAKDAPADDRWIAGEWIGNPNYGIAQNASTFSPKHLNLLHMAILGKVVHNEEPVYSLFKNNCFWFSNIFFISAQVIDNTIILRPNSTIPEFEIPEDGNVTGMFYMPFQMYMPDIAGRYLGFKICEVRKVVVRRIVKLFFEQLQKHDELVSFTCFELPHVVNLLIGCGAGGCRFEVER
jgi:hypothetical protein